MAVPFRVIPGPHPDEPAFVVELAGSRLKPGDFPAFGTAYSNVNTTLRPRMAEGWDAWKFGEWKEQAGSRPPLNEDNAIGFYFYKNLPSTPIQIGSIDVDIFGPINRYRYMASTGDEIPDRGDLWTVPGGGSILWEDGEEILWEDGTTMDWEDSEFVYDATEAETESGLTWVTVMTTPINTVTRTDDIRDAETGRVLPRTRTWTLSSTKPDTQSDLNPDTGQYTTVESIGYNLWLTTTQLASGLPASRVTAITWDTMESTYWPEVLENYNFHYVLNESLQWWDQLLSYAMRDPYTAPVRTTKRLWFQYTAPVITEPDEMLPSGIRVAGKLMSFTLPPCLHEEFVYEEPNFVAPLNTAVNDTLASMVVWTFGATSQTDWAPTITRMRVNFRNGGYECEETTYNRPVNFNTANHTVGRRAITATDGIRHRYSLVTLTPGTDFVI